MILHMREIDPVVWVRPQPAGESDQLEIVCDGKPELVEQHVVVRTQTEHVVSGVGSVKRATERPDVRSFSVRPCRRFKSLAADLALVIVQPFHPPYDGCAPHDALRLLLPPRR